MELRVPPPVVFAIAALLMWLVARHLPQFAVALPGRDAAAGVLAAIGAAFDVAGIVQFLRARTTVHPMRPERSAALVTWGVYAYTRNPMYLGLALLLLAWAVYLAHPLALVVIPGFVAYLNRFQIAPEERALSRTFGEAFDAYRRRVRRWL